MVCIKIEMTEQEADDYAQFLKRVRFDQYRENAQTDTEAYGMQVAGEKIRVALAETGFAPR
jgi:hypothetical protein